MPHAPGFLCSYKLELQIFQQSYYRNNQNKYEYRLPRLHFMKLLENVERNVKKWLVGGLKILTNILHYNLISKRYSLRFYSLCFVVKKFQEKKNRFARCSVCQRNVRLIIRKMSRDNGYTGWEEEFLRWECSCIKDDGRIPSWNRFITVKWSVTITWRRVVIINCIPLMFSLSQT